MKKTFLTKSDIENLTERANGIVNRADFTRLAAIGRKYGLQLIYDKRTNANLVWQVWFDMLDALPQKANFRKELEAKRIWQDRKTNPTIIQKFIESIGCSEELNFLRDQKWDELRIFSTSTLGSYGLPTDGNVTPLIKTGGEYGKYFAQWDKSSCDKEAIKLSTDLKAKIDSLFAEISEGERLNLAHVIVNHSTHPMTWEQFHNSLFIGQ